MKVLLFCQMFISGDHSVLLVALTALGSRPHYTVMVYNRVVKTALLAGWLSLIAFWRGVTAAFRHETNNKK
jgi:hypothetical protein